MEVSKTLKIVLNDDPRQPPHQEQQPSYITDLHGDARDIQSNPITSDGHMDNPGKVRGPIAAGAHLNQTCFNQQGQQVCGDQYNAERIIIQHCSAPAEQFAGLEVARRVEALIEEYTTLFVGRTAEWQQIDDFVAGAVLEQRTLVITADAGFGKSALLANWAQRQRTNGVFVAAHFFSQRHNLRSPIDAYRNLLHQIYTYYDLTDAVIPATDATVLRDELYGTLETRGTHSGTPLFILLDALDEAEQDIAPFPLIRLPADIRVIVSARADAHEQPAYLRGWTDQAHRLHLSRLPQPAIAEWVRRSGDEELYNLAEDPAFVADIETTTQGFPLYLRFLVEEMVATAKDGQDVRAVLARSPQGFSAYVEQQMDLLIDELGGKHNLQDFFALLAVALGPLTEDDIFALTQMNELDILPHQQITRWLNIQHRSDETRFTFDHPLLAKEFGTASGLRRQTRQMRNKLLNYCANWQHHQSHYALRHYADHLYDQQQYDDLYVLARNTMFLQTQAQTFPSTPDLPLRTLQIALQGAADADSAGEMAAFLLRHATHVREITQESPLEALRAGSLERARQLVDLADAERRALWYLLLAWELCDVDKPDQAREILARLQTGELPRLSGWESQYAAYLLAALWVCDEAACERMYPYLVEEQYYHKLCSHLSAQGRPDIAIQIDQSLSLPWHKAEALRDIALAYARQSDIGTALRIALTIASDDSFDRRDVTLAGIVQTQARKGEFVQARHTLQEIRSDGWRAVAMGVIAIAQEQAKQPEDSCLLFDDAIDMARGIRNWRHKNRTLGLLASLQCDQGNFAAAWNIAQYAFGHESHVYVQQRIATEQARSGAIADALQTVQGIANIPEQAVQAYGHIAVAYATAGQHEEARQIFDKAALLAHQANESVDQAQLLALLAIAQQSLGYNELAEQQLTVALQTVQHMGDIKKQADVYQTIAVWQVQEDQADKARRTFAFTLQTLRDTHDTIGKALALKDIATLYAQAGQAAIARETFAVAIQIAKDAIAQGVDYDWCLSLLKKIAIAQAETVGFEDALHTAKHMDDGVLQDRPSGSMALSWAQYRTFGKLALLQAQAGDFDGALLTAQDIHEMSERVSSLSEIAHTQAQAGQGEAAHQSLALAVTIAPQIDVDTVRMAAIKDIGIAQARIGDFDAAFETVRSLPHLRHQVAVMAAIATAQAQRGYAQAAHGSIEGALRSVEEIAEQRDKADALHDIATAQAQIGEIHAALQTARQIAAEQWAAEHRGLGVIQAKALTAIARIQAQANPADAHQTFEEAIQAALCEGARTVMGKNWALVRIAEAQIQAGFSDFGIQTANSMLGRRNEYIPQIAAALLEASDLSGFKRMLVPGAYHLDAAYRLCGVLAKAYPKQISAIAQVVTAGCDL